MNVMLAFLTKVKQNQAQTSLPTMLGIPRSVQFASGGGHMQKLNKTIKAKLCKCTRLARISVKNSNFTSCGRPVLDANFNENAKTEGS